MAVLLWTVAPLAVLHLWLWRRHRRLLRFQLLVDVGLLVVLGPAVFTGRDLNPVRCVMRTVPYVAWQWDAATELQPTQSDLVLQFHPWWEDVRRQLAEGRLPLLSPRMGGGLPLLANGQSGLFAPVMAPVWALGPERGSTVMAFWKLEASAMGAFLLVLVGLRLPFRSAGVTGLAWGVGQYQVSWLLVPLAWVVASLPWVWWLMLTLVRGRARWWRIVAAGVFLGWLLGSGLHPETAAVVIGSAWMAALLTHPRRWLRVAAVAAVMFPVAVALAWPTTSYIRSAAKYEHYREIQPNRVGLSGELQRAVLAQLMVPAIHGHPGRGDWRAPYPQAAVATGVGGAVLGVIAAGAVRRRRRRYLFAALACLGVAAVLVYRVPPLDGLLVRIPPFDRMTLPRFACLAAWGMALWAGLAMEGLRDASRRRWFGPALLMVSLLGVMIVMPPGGVAVDQALVLLTVVAAGVVGLRGATLARFIVPLVLVELAALAWGLNPVAAPSDRLPMPPAMTRLQELAAEEGGRVMGLAGALPPNLAGRYGLEDLRSFDPLRPASLATMMGFLGEPEPVLGGPLQRAPARLCGAWSVRFVVAPDGAYLPAWREEVRVAGTTIWRNPEWLPVVRLIRHTHPLADDEGWELLLSEELDFRDEAVVPSGVPLASAVSAELVDLEDGIRRVTATADCDGPCLLLVARPLAPGWTARVDGRQVPLVAANLAGLGVMLPSGRHVAELSYHPWSW